MRGGRLVARKRRKGVRVRKAKKGEGVIGGVGIIEPWRE